MKVLLTGGGTGGHITPLLAVAHRLKTAYPGTETIYVGERDSKFAELTAHQTVFDRQYAVSAGKFRRYHGKSFISHVVDVKTNLLNARDFFRFVSGYFQASRVLKHEKPDVILLKGGFVGVPIGLAAARRRIPFVTHDSDILPGLANRMVGRWATYHATGMPEEYYSYPKEQTKHVGVLVGETYVPVTQELQLEYRRQLGIPEDCLLLTITGGSLGSQKVNEAMLTILPSLLKAFPSLYVVHQVGKGNAAMYGDYKSEHVQVMEFLEGMHRYTGAADVVVTRAGANTLAELGVQGKALIVIPNPLLTGGHQLKNAERLQQEEAIVVVDEERLAQPGQTGEGSVLFDAVARLLHDTQFRLVLGHKLQTLTVPDAVERLSALLVEVGSKKGS